MKTKLYKSWPSYFIKYRKKALEICAILDEEIPGEYRDRNEIDPTGEYYLVETDNTNGYGYHIGGEPKLDVRKKWFETEEDIFCPEQLGHARIIAKIVIVDMVAEITKFEAVICNREAA